MPGISIKHSITINDADMLKNLERMVERMDNPVGFYRNVGEHMLNTLGDNFDRQTAPDGTPWKPLKPATVKAREKKRLTPITILRARGRLRGSFNLQATVEGATLGSPVEYAAIHFLGGKIEKKARQHTIYQHYDEKTDTLDQKFRKKNRSNFARDVTVGAHTITIPARPYAGVSKEDEKIIFGIADDWLRG
ncbi:phage virion morphogenesis protein [Brucella pituitosa]|uniref:phage virion morphogenesis protein n=1 Tax=Brucella pituitosa TaxID=571256 RepID=UPI003F4AA362